MKPACLTIFAASALLEGLIEDGRGGRARLKPIDGASGMRAAIDFSQALPQTFWRDETPPQSADIVSAIGCAVSRHGADKTWSGRDAWALLFAAMLRSASKQIASPVTAIKFIPPPGLNEMDRACLIIAGHLAGASTVDVCSLGELLSIEGGREGGVHLLLQFDAHVLHAVCLDRDAEQDKGVEADWSDSHSGTKIAEMLVEMLEPPDNVREAVKQWALDAIPTRRTSQSAWLANDRGQPVVALLPHAVLDTIANDVAQLVCKWLAGFGNGVCNPDILHLHGAWADLLAAPMQAAFPKARLVDSGDLSAPLDYSAAPEIAVPILQGDITTAATGAMSVQTHTVLTLVRAGTQLPHVLVNDSVETGLFLRDFSLFYKIGNAKEPLEIGVVAIPPMLEQVSHSRIVVRVLADTSGHLVFTTTLGQGLSSQGAIFDKHRKSSEPITPAMLEALGYL